MFFDKNVFVKRCYQVHYRLKTIDHCFLLESDFLEQHIVKFITILLYCTLIAENIQVKRQQLCNIQFWFCVYNIVLGKLIFKNVNEQTHHQKHS